MLKVGEPLPTFALPVYPSGELTNADLLGRRTVIFIYPKDDTYG
jgi:peroxiredoxin